MLQCVKYRFGANQRASASLRELCEFARLGEGNPFGENVTDTAGLTDPTAAARTG